LDPQDIGRTYEPIIRINSQSGKGGVAYILEQHYGIQMPKRMQQDFGSVVKAYTDKLGAELPPEQLYELFDKTYINIESPICLARYNEHTNGQTAVDARLTVDGEEKFISGEGSGILDAFCKALRQDLNLSFEIIQYSEHSLEYSSRSRAITYVEISDAQGRKQFGAGVSSSISKSSMRAVISALNVSMR
jgi:2-isopropylmalate synthase